jgi:hypothetical protein
MKRAKKSAQFKLQAAIWPIKLRDYMKNLYVEYMFQQKESEK